MLKETCFPLLKIHEISIATKKNNRTTPLKLLGYFQKLDETKNKISSMRYKKWTNLRKLVNEFEFPPESETKIQRPISRAFFKLVEMLVDFKMDLNSNTLHLAEAPGGFIESSMFYKSKMYNQLKNLYTFSLNIAGDKDIPSYNEKITSKKNVIVLSNKENRGDLYCIKNIEFLVNFLKTKQIKFITCDGGFTDKNNFSAKEHLHHKLIFNQMIVSLFILENNGSFIIKFFDIFTELSFDFVYILSFLFEKVSICKPHTSRPTNSERYIVCKFFIKHRFNKLSNKLKSLCISGIENYSSIIDKQVLRPDYVSVLKNINIKLSDHQIKSIENIVNINETDLKIKKTNENTNQWIEKYINF